MKPLILTLAIICASFIQSFAVAPITGTTNVCPGFTTPLIDATSGGTWSTSDATVAAVAATTGVVTGVLAGTVTITYMVGTAYAVTSFTVNPTPDPISGITAICLGSTATLSDIDPGGSWSSSNAAVAPVGSASGTVTGLALGSAAITFTLPTGCNTSTAVTVYPNPSAIGGASTVCVGNFTSLTDASGGGTWSSSNTTVALIVSSSGVLTGVTPGTSVITYTLATGCFVTRTEAVAPTPSVIGWSFSVCVGSSVTLPDGSGGTWSSSNTAVGSVSSTGVLTGVSAGTTNVTYSLGGTCRAEHEITVVATPDAITGPGAVCIGGTTTLTDATGGGTWTSASTATATIGSAGTVTGISLGTTIITYFVTSSCQTMETFAVVTAPDPISGFTYLAEGGSEPLTDLTSGGTWSSSDPAIATVGSLTGIVTGISTGAATITYSIGTDCMSIYSIYIFVEGIANLNLAHDITFYPNPATDVLTIQTAPTAYNAYSITNETGQLITTGNITTSLTNVNVGTLPPGLYFISLKGSSGRMVQKFLKD